MKGTIIAAIFGVSVLGAQSSASAGEVFTLLGGEQGSVQNLVFDGDADTELIWRGYRGFGGFRGGIGYRGVGWGRPYAWGARAFYRPYWGGYRGFAYRPWRSGYGVGVPYYFGGGYYNGGYYTPSYYYGCGDAPSVVYSLDLGGNANDNGAPVMPPANGNSTYQYNGNPQPPAANPAPPSQPAVQPRPTLPLKGRLVSLPKDTFLAYGEKAAPSAPAATPPTVPQRYSYQAYGESRTAPAQKAYRVSQNRP